MISIRKKIPVRGLFKMTRGYNLFIIFLTQCLVYIFLIGRGWQDIDYIFHLPFIILALSTTAIAAAGYIINDYHDVKIDMINKPGRVVVGSVINRRIALLLYIFFSITGIALAFIVSWKIGLVNIFAAGLLWLYSVSFKKVAFWGNFSIAILTALSILIIYVWRPSAAGISLLVYAWFAFIITLIREIVKDMEDVRGDKAFGCRTLPIIWGIAGTSRFLYVLCGLMIASLLAAFIYTNDFILRFFASIVVLQVIYLIYCLRITDTIKGFRKLGKFCKVIMLTGIVAMLFL